MADGNPISNDMIQRILQKKGGADTPENVGRIRAFYGANPDQAERFAMGMPGNSSANEDRSDLLNLDKQMAKIDGTPAIQQQELPTPVVATPAPAPALAPQRAAPQGPMQGPGAPLVGTASDSAHGPVAEPGSSWDWLLPLLVGGAAASQMRNPNSGSTPETRMQGRIEDFNRNNPRLTYDPQQPQIEGGPRAGQRQLPSPTQRLSGPPGQPALPNEAGPQYQGGATEIPRGAPQAAGAANQDPAEIARIKAEVDAENRNSAALMEQMQARTAAEQRARELAQAARRATGRR